MRSSLQGSERKALTVSIKEERSVAVEFNNVSKVLETAEANGLTPEQARRAFVAALALHVSAHKSRNR